jgi:hypothetical protein
MKVLVDTSVWSLALRRSSPQDSAHVRELTELISELRVQMVGPVRQELLSGIRHQKQFESLRDHLRPFPDLIIEREEYEYAAEIFNTLRSKGVQASNTDILLCSTSIRRKMPFFTIDNDFIHIAKHILLELHQPRG